MNYCRSLLLQLQKNPKLKNVEPENPIDMDADTVRALLDGAEKFLLPDGGVILDDPSFCALDPTKRLRLPFQKIVLEYSNSENAGSPVEPDPTGDPRLALMSPTKRMLIASEIEFSSVIVCQPIFWFPGYGCWVCMDPFIIPMLNYLIDGKNGMKSFITSSSHQGRNEYTNGAPLLSLLNALMCTNVGTERFSTGKTSASSKKTKAVLPFDSYTVLVLNGGRGGTHSGHTGPHRSPREHVRRGCIVRQSNGKLHWRNATIVAAGSGARVGKIYRLV